MAHYLLEQETRALSYQEFSGHLKSARRKPSIYSSAKNMYNGDLWDRGRGYIGPLPENGSTEGADIIGNIRRRWVGRNVIQEVVDRAVDGILSRSPSWTIYNTKNLIARSIAEAKKRDELKQRLELTNISIDSLIQLDPTKTQLPGSTEPNKPILDNEQTDNNESEEDQKIAEAEIILSEAWSLLKIGERFKQSFTERMVVGQGKLRYHVTKAYDKFQPNLETSFIDVLKFIKLEFVENFDCKIIDDDGDKLAITRIQAENKNKETVEVCFVDDDGLTYLASYNQKTAAIGNTILSPAEDLDSENQQEVSEIIKKVKNSGAVLSTGFNLAGQLMVDEISGGEFVSESLIQQNRGLNLALSLAANVLVEAGFPELILTNVNLDDPNNPGQKLIVKRGNHVTNNFIGEQSIDKDGAVQFEKPGVFFKEPSKVDSFKEGADLFYNQSLAETKQSFVAGNKESIISGESRIQARQDFLKKEQRYKPDMDTHGKWGLTTLLHLVAELAGRPGYFRDYTIVFDTKVYAGELSADEKNVVVTQYEKGLIDRESAMVLLGIEDPLLVIDQIRLDQAEALELQVRRLVATSKYSQIIQNQNSGNQNIDNSNNNSIKNNDSKNTN